MSKSKDISLLIEIHNLHGGTNLYRQIVEFLDIYNFKIEFENTYESGEKHMIVRKARSSDNNRFEDSYRVSASKSN